MSVWRRFDGHGFPSLVTTNVANRRPVFTDRDNAAHLKVVLFDVMHEEHADLIAWVIMPDHVHLVVSLRRTASLGRLMQLIKGRFAREHNAAIGRVGSVWQERYHEEALRDERQLHAAVQYVLHSPVKGGLAATPDEYPWCSASGLAPFLGSG